MYKYMYECIVLLNAYINGLMTVSVVRSKALILAVVSSLFVVASIVCGSFVVGTGFVV